MVSRAWIGSLLVFTNPQLLSGLVFNLKMVRCLIYVLFLLQTALAVQSLSNWKTLSGDAPAVIARGGYSGLFPESSEFANSFSLSTSLSDLILFCDLQLTKDGTGFCQSSLRLDNTTNIALIYPDGQKAYAVNGKSLRGWFSIDYTEKQLFSGVALTQSIYSRPSLFDGILPMSTVDDVSGLRPPRLWLNAQYDLFYKQHNLNMVSFLVSASKRMIIDYVSSPEVGFLKSINGKLSRGKAKLVFRFLDKEATEPSTKRTYGSLLDDLLFIKTFAAGILVPKDYICPVNADLYLQPCTTLVADAHKEGLEVHAYVFANDMPASYNYSYDPTAEYLQFIDNSDFSVDGLLTDFPSTASEAVGCLAHSKNNNSSSSGKPLIITHNGASGVYPACTDLSYQQAVEDGANIIDCSVQMTKDGVPICLDSVDLISGTTALTSFVSKSSVVPQIQANQGIFSFDLTWSEIQTLKPELSSPNAQDGLLRNPANKNQGSFMTLSDFLSFAKDKAVDGVLINIQNAAYLASEKGLSITDTVKNALSNASFDTQQVLIQSDDSSVLSLFRQGEGNNYKLVFMVEEVVSNADQASIDKIKQLADAVNLPRTSIISSSDSFLTGFTGIVDKFHAANISVYVSVLRNEFMAIAFDLFSDPIMEINNYVQTIGVDGLVTEYPATASAYMRSACSNSANDAAYYIPAVQPGSLLSLAPADVQPPAEAPSPVLSVAEVIDPPLPAVSNISDSAVPPPTTLPVGSGQPATAAALSFVLSMFMVVLSLLSASIGQL